MASTKEIKDRIASVQETRKITNAMHLIASTKLRRARLDLAETRPCFETIRAELPGVLRAAGEPNSRWFRGKDGAPPPGGVPGIVLITADKGMAGAYNVNAIREAERLMKGRTPWFCLVGDCGRRWYRQHCPDSAFLFYPAQKPTVARAKEIVTELLRRCRAGELNELTVVYTEMKNSIVSAAAAERLLPLDRPAARDAGSFELLPSREAVFEAALSACLTAFLYGALTDSFCCEQNARVSAMDAANRNAEELLGDLSLQLNRKRQAAITQEITEVSAGAKAQQRKSGKEAGIS